jgi:hypothetical protein
MSKTSFKGTRYFQSQIEVLPEVESDIAEYSVQAVGLLIGALETRKARSFFVASPDWLEAYDQICELQRGLLMGAKRDIIKEIRSARGDFYGDTQNIDPDIVGVGLYAGASLNDVLLAIRPTSTSDTVDSQLTAINTKLQTIIDSAQSPEQQEALMTILQNILLALA